MEEREQKKVGNNCFRALLSLIFDTIRTKKGERGLSGITSNGQLNLSTSNDHHRDHKLTGGRCSDLHVIKVENGFPKWWLMYKYIRCLAVLRMYCNSFDQTGLGQRQFGNLDRIGLTKLDKFEAF